ncbi:MAG: hypothetical protein WC917_00055 [Bacilli bacterium]
MVEQSFSSVLLVTFINNMHEILVEGVLTIKDHEGRLVAIAYTDMKKKAQVVYKVSECNQDDIKELLESLRSQITQ